MKLKLNKTQVTEFKNLMTILKPINKEVYFKVNSDKLIMKSFDASNAMYYKVEMDKVAFDGYEGDIEVDGQINVVTLNKWLKMFKSEMDIEFTEKYVTLSSSSRKVPIDVYVVENIVRDIEMADDKFDSIFQIDATDYSNIISDVGMSDESSVAFHVNKETLYVVNGKVEARLESKVEVDKGDTEYISKYNFTYLKYTYIHKLISNICLKIGHNKPMLIEATGNGVLLQMVIAPLGDND